MLDEIIAQEIEKAITAMFPHGEGRASRAKVEHWLTVIAQRAFTEGSSHALMTLLTVEDVAERFGVTPRRVRALARNRHERFGIGWQVPGTNQWLFRPEELEKLQPNDRYKRKIKKEEGG